MDKFGPVFLLCLVAVAVNAKDPSLALSNSIKGRLLTPQEGCGYSAKISKPKIVGGMPAKQGAFPWMVLLGKSQYGDTIFDCGGSLITSRHVLTAAHCVSNILNVARLGEHDITTTSDGPHQDVPIIKRVMHPEYDDIEIINDIAVLTLAYDVEFTDLIRPVCLPFTEEKRSRDFVGFNPFISGWGHLHENGFGSDVLQMVQLPVVANEQCENLYKQMEYVEPGRFDHRVMCAGFLEGGKDSCQGDSGGPLVLPLFENGKFPAYQIGVVSYGNGCARKDTPGVYTRVTSFIDWIQQQIEE